MLTNLKEALLLNAIFENPGNYLAEVQRSHLPNAAVECEPLNHYIHLLTVVLLYYLN